jgi:formylglycine-generating enzyme required for sulfatase activity
MRETGMYDGAPFVEEWKPLPPRLHAEAAEDHTVEIGAVAVATTEVTGADGAPLTGLSLAEAREHAASLGARLPTEFEWQLAAADPAFRRAEPLVWNWTESEHSDGITRFAILKGGCAYEALGSEWYFDGGPRPPEFSAKLLLVGLGIDRSTSIGFRLAWDL